MKTFVLLFLLFPDVVRSLAIPASCTNQDAYQYVTQGPASGFSESVATCCPQLSGSSQPCGQDKGWGSCIDTFSDPTFKACAHTSHNNASQWFFPWLKYCKCNQGYAGPGCADRVPIGPVVRKDYVLGLTDKERTLFNQVWTNMLKTTTKYRNPIGTYDTVHGFNTIAAMAALHQWVSNWQGQEPWPMNPSLVDSGHNGTGFVGFHRLLTMELENEMHANGWPFHLGVPYWNITIQDKKYWDVIYSPSGLGSNGDLTTAPRYIVRDGPMAYETIFNADGTVYPYPLNLFSRFVDFTVSGLVPYGRVLTWNQTYGLVAYELFDAPPFSGTWLPVSGFRHVLENTEHSALNITSITLNEGYHLGPHNWGHLINGGQMGPPIGPYDPVFFLHHNFVDHLVDQWIEAHPGSKYPIPESFHNSYIDAADYGPLGCVHVYPPRQHQDLFVATSVLGYTYEFADLSRLSSTSSSSSLSLTASEIAAIVSVIFVGIVVVAWMFVINKRKQGINSENSSSSGGIKL